MNAALESITKIDGSAASLADYAGQVRLVVTDAIDTALAIGDEP